MAEALESMWNVFVDMLAVVDWASPWTWFAILGGLMLLAAANR